jgi:hypothetical protein
VSQFVQFFKHFLQIFQNLFYMRQLRLCEITTVTREPLLSKGIVENMDGTGLLISIQRFAPELLLILGADTW